MAGGDHKDVVNIFMEEDVPESIILGRHIDIRFESVNLSSGTSISDRSKIDTTIKISLNLSRKDVEKFSSTKITIEQLYEIINNRE